MWKRGNSDGRYCVTCHFFLEIKDSKFKGVSLLRVWIHESIYHSVSCCLLCIAEAILSFQRDWLTGIPRASSHLGMSFSPFLFWQSNPRDGIMLKRHEMGLESKKIKNQVCQVWRENFQVEKMAPKNFSLRSLSVFGSDFGISVTGSFSGSTCKCSQSLRDNSSVDFFVVWKKRSANMETPGLSWPGS